VVFFSAMAPARVRTDDAVERMAQADALLVIGLAGGVFGFLDFAAWGSWWRAGGRR
jgi:hypothetical protein